MMSSKPRVALSFDIECYYQIVSKDYLGKSIEPTTEVVANTNWLLDELKRHGAHATFFFLGNVARNFPQLVRRASDEGHEIGVHGDQHLYIDRIDQGEFEEEVKLAKEAILAAGAREVVGHRAPAFSINKGNLWALDVLKQNDIVYDSSIYPFDGSRYGEPTWPLDATLQSNGIIEIPLSIVEMFSKRFPALGGGYVRYFPYLWTRYCIKRISDKGRVPVAYFHPYEFEVSKPDLNRLNTNSCAAGALNSLKRFNFLQSIGRGLKMRKKLTRMLAENEIIPIGSMPVSR